MQAKGTDTAAQAALSELCAAYYEPVVTFLRSRCGREDAAREQAHAFFERVLSNGSLGGAEQTRGRFRSYLLGAVKHFIADEHDRLSAVKRGAGIEPGTLGDADVSPALESAEPEHAFDRQWALTVMARALDVVASELHQAGRSAHFETLKPWLTGESAALSQAAAAQELVMSESAVKVAIHRLRQRFREQVKAEIAQTVPSGADIEDELRHLVAVLVGR